MKKLLNQLVLFSAIGGTLFLASCGSDDPEPVIDGPTISAELTSGQTVENGIIEASSGAVLSFDVDISAPGGFNTLRVTNSTTGDVVTEINRNDLGLDAGIVVVPTITTALTLPSVNTNTFIDVEFLVVDDNNTTATENITIEILAEPNVDIYDAFLLAAPLGDGSSDTFFSTNNGVLYSDDDVINSTDNLSANIDFGYYYGETNLASIAGIEAYPTNVVNVDAWNFQNATLFRTSTMSEADFDAIGEFDSDELAAEYEVASAEAGQKNQLSAGTILAFKTDATKDGGSKFGLLKVVSVSGTDGQGDGINIEVKVAK